jgi:hypothetical protein
MCQAAAECVDYMEIFKVGIERLPRAGPFIAGVNTMDPPPLKNVTNVTNVTGVSDGGQGTHCKETLRGSLVVDGGLRQVEVFVNGVQGILQRGQIDDAVYGGD